ncbi:ACT domain-containing protein [Demequina aestuarii]|uniref:ACT domain-containing protein n=1 Tax=Demequina aestuarii TaxID=327095 RepID=UPI0007816935|nr:ACT domain-containing protein [Demequina aestuarii]
MPGERDLDTLIATMRPALDPVTYVWASMEGLAAAGALIDAVATVREAEGWSLVLPIDAASRHGLEFTFPSARLTLTVESALEAVGLTAAVAGALADAGIAANVVAGFHHDHVFVPRERAADAVAALADLADGEGSLGPSEGE